jgi:hypothetical protein
MRNKITEEEKVARTIGKIVSDLRLDLEMVGMYLAWGLPNVSLRRLFEIVESAEYEKENKNGNYIR